MILDLAMLAHLEKLAALDDASESNSERARRCVDLGHIVEHVRTLEALADEAPAAASEAALPLRADEPRPGLDHATALRGAGHADGESFLVPRIVP